LADVVEVHQLLDVGPGRLVDLERAESLLSHESRRLAQVALGSFEIFQVILAETEIDQGFGLASPVAGQTEQSHFKTARRLLIVFGQE